MNRAFIDTSAILRMLVQDDDLKAKAVENLIRKAPEKGLVLHVIPVTILEIVRVLEKVYKYPKKAIRELAEAIINTPQLKVELAGVFLNALKVYEEKNVKFADAVMAFWGMDKGITTTYTYDEKDFKRIDGLTVLKP
ncbi:MAG: PIN domain-containing protein [Verrucomicrobia bacterium]|nr:PIN domain-containing protein [Deltaproteobacteria bacterium]